MDRRTFTRTAGLGIAATTIANLPLSSSYRFEETAGAAEPARPSRALMKVGTQHGSSDEVLGFLSGLGVNNICSDLPSARFDDNWSVAGLKKLKDRVESYGIKLDMIPLPLSSVTLDKSENPNILRGKSPERDREIDNICRMIQNAGQAGIPAVKYNMSVLGVVRSDPTPGRGRSSYSTFDYEKALGKPPQNDFPPVNADQYWERITYFLERVVPVAEECKVRIACHPNDPGMPADKGYRGVHTALGSVEGLKRFVDIKPSKYHGLNFCQGSICEMLDHPGEQIFEVIRYFGTRGKIFNVHFRNVRGGFLHFSETFIDDGDVDMLKALRVYQEVGYDGMIMPDHVPKIEGDLKSHQAFAFTFGYIKALIAALQPESPPAGA
jgi:mannonate dehydratase